MIPRNVDTGMMRRSRGSGRLEPYGKFTPRSSLGEDADLLMRPKKYVFIFLKFHALHLMTLTKSPCSLISWFAGFVMLLVVGYRRISRCVIRLYQNFRSRFLVPCSDAGDSLNDCQIKFLTEIYKIEEPGCLSDTPAGSESPLKSRLQRKLYI